MQVVPVRVVYDGACEAASQLALRRPGLLEDNGRVPRLGVAGGAVDTGGGSDPTGGLRAAEDGETSTSLPRVHLPQLAHLGSHSESSTLEVINPCSIPVEPVRSSSADVYALRDASLPQPGVQSQLDMHKLLHRSGRQGEIGGVGTHSFLAATKSLAALLREGIRILSLFEVLVFTYHWHRKVAEGGLVSICLTADGWTLEALGRSTAPLDGPRHGAIPSLAQGGGANEEALDPISNGDAAEFLRELLVVAIGSRNGKVPLLPVLVEGGGATLGDLPVDKDTAAPFSTVIKGLRYYAKVSTFNRGRKKDYR